MISSLERLFGIASLLPLGIDPAGRQGAARQIRRIPPMNNARELNP